MNEPSVMYTILLYLLQMTDRTWTDIHRPSHTICTTTLRPLTTTSIGSSDDVLCLVVVSGGSSFVPGLLIGCQWMTGDSRI